jgi:pimeloyl-ACP methyl ester carboxylesterase
MHKFLFVFILFGVSICISQDDGVKFRKEEISFNAGRFFVTGTLLLPEEGNNFPAVVLCWGSGPTDRKYYIENSKTMRTFLKEGYAFFVEDKPGSGESTGEFSGDSIFYERAMILKKEIEILKSHKEINPKKIGLFGSSQAGYVMPVVLNMTDDVAFMIAVSCPAMNSLQQSAYLVKMQILCGGGTTEEGEKAEKYFIQRRTAETYKDYLEAAEYLDRQNVIKDLGWGGIIEEKDFEAADKNNISFFNPTGLIEKIKIPVLAIFGEKDTQIDPLQGMSEYKRALDKSENRFYKVIMINGVDHNMREMKTGSLKEQKESYGKEGLAKLSLEYIEIISNWLKEHKEN